MKKIILIFTAFTFSLAVLSQGNTGAKGKNKQKNKTENSGVSVKDEKIKKEMDDHNRKVWDGVSENGKGPKPSKNQPAKVRASFQRDYPNANNVSWSKYRGDWTATFGNGLNYSTAVYHANGDRRDTRTPVTRNEMPKNVLDSVFKRRPGTRLDDIIKIEVPNVVKDIFRVKDVIQGRSEYFYYNRDGVLVKYNY
ncbi:MAG TPA: hypothetical protein VI548_12015 [Chitinophagaceae bacterium]|nr:hypothetical protein [Chitinophagaceae bacterium]